MPSGFPLRASERIARTPREEEETRFSFNFFFLWCYLIAFKIKYYGIRLRAPVSAGGGIRGHVPFRGNSQNQKKKREITGEFKPAKT